MDTKQNTVDAVEIMTADDLKKHPLIIWLHGQYEQHGCNKSSLARTFGGIISSKSIGLLLEGRYEYDISGMLHKLQQLKDRLDGQLTPAEAADLDHIPTPMMSQVWSACYAANSAHLVNIVAGKSQIGKSTAVEAYKARYNDTTILMRMPTRPTMFSVAQELCAAAGLSKIRTLDEAIAALRGKLTASHLIIADEAHLCLGSEKGAEVLDMLRELYDRCRCGLVLIVTDTGAREFIRGKFAGRLAQLERRGEWELLPQMPCEEDVRVIWQAYGLPEPDKKTLAAVHAMVRQDCFGKYVHRLKWAAVQARRAQQPLSWQFFLQATAAMSDRPS